MKNEVRTIGDRINQCEFKEVRATVEIAKGHQDQATMAYRLMRDLRGVFSLLEAEYKPVNLSKNADKGFEKLAEAEAFMNQAKPGTPDSTVASMISNAVNHKPTPK